MANSLAKAFYLRALDNYPFDLAEAWENLNYALGYDENFAAANCLKGSLENDYLNDPEEAEYYFEKVLAENPRQGCAIMSLISLYLNWPKLGKAENLIKYAFELNEIPKYYVYWANAALLERRGALKLSKAYLQKSLNQCLNDNQTDFVTNELQRIEDKLKAIKKLKGSRKKTTKGRV